MLIFNPNTRRGRSQIFDLTLGIVGTFVLVRHFWDSGSRGVAVGIGLTMALLIGFYIGFLIRRRR